MHLFVFLMTEYSAHGTMRTIIWCRNLFLRAIQVSPRMLRFKAMISSRKMARSNLDMASILVYKYNLFMFVHYRLQVYVHLCWFISMTHFNESQNARSYYHLLPCCNARICNFFMFTKTFLIFKNFRLLLCGNEKCENV